MTAIDSTARDVTARVLDRQVPATSTARRFLNQTSTRVGLAILGAFVIGALLAPILTPYEPAEQDLARILEGPSTDHLMGTDDLGRDVFTRVLYGARISLAVSFGVVAVALVVALFLGLLAGYRGGRTDAVIMRATDVLFAFPPLILALVVRALLGPSMINLVLAVAIVFVPSFVRLIRGQILSVREETYIEASRSVGVPGPMLVRRHVLPNIAGPVVVQAALALGFALLAEAGLSFLGFGAPPPAATWGTMLRRAFDFVLEVPYQVFVPGGAITLAVLAYNLLGEGMNAALGRDRPPRSWRSASPRLDSAARPASPTADAEPVLRIEGLTVELRAADTPDWVPVVRDVSLDVPAGSTLGLVGESGCGKTMTALAAMGLLPSVGRIAAGSVRVGGRELVGLSRSALRDVRGPEIAMVFQDPATSLNPAFTVGDQLVESIRAHEDVPRRVARRRAIEALGRVGIAQPASRVDAYPHEFSGGMRQRAMIAMALVSSPRVLLADEPTTALDVTVQAEILELLRALQDETGMALVFVTHDLAVVAELCDHIVVMYAGEVVEQGGVIEAFDRPRHPYTRALLDALPERATPGQPLGTIPGQVPGPGDWPDGCHFADRCDFVVDRCRGTAIPLERVSTGRTVRCRRHEDLDLGEVSA